MFTKKFILASLVVLSFFSAISQQIKFVASPNGNVKVNFILTEKGEPQYEAFYKNKPIILPSSLGFELKEIFGDKIFQPLNKNLLIVRVDTSSYNESWQPVWGDRKEIADNHHTLTIKLKQQSSDALELNIVFKVFDDGFGFRYEFPKQPNLTHFIVIEENTSFHLNGNHKAFWIPGDFDSNEYPPSITNLSDVDALSITSTNPEIAVKTPVNANTVQTPLMLKTADGIYINIHEAALVNYPAMNLEINKSSYNLSAVLVPDAVGNKAYLQAPATTPWRTIIVSDKATDILASKIILNLNEPSVIKNTSWIKPTKFMGVWWEMFIGKGTWDYASGKHAANTANVKKYIDFASKHKFDAILVEGWNVGWEDWFGQWKEKVFDFVTPYPDFNVKELQQYAKSKNVKIIMHHETSGSASNYERQMDTAYRFMKQFGYDAVKTGYVGKIIPRGEHHDGQTMVNHYVHVAQKTAQFQIMLDAHEPVRPTGLQRTYPNWLACEAGRGMEFNAFSKGNNPNHETIMPFTRMMGGPMDFTPGIFQMDLSYWDKTKTQKVHTTIAKQLALYVVFCSPLQMAADLPESYEKHLDAFQFIKDVAVDWDDSKYLEAEPGEYITTARKAKKKDTWFVGAITNEKARQTTIALNFLDKNKKYKATIYADAKDADWQTNPQAYQITTITVDSNTVLPLSLAASGGCAISIVSIK